MWKQKIRYGRGPPNGFFSLSLPMGQVLPPAHYCLKCLVLSGDLQDDHQTHWGRSARDAIVYKRTIWYILKINCCPADGRRTFVWFYDLWNYAQCDNRLKMHLSHFGQNLTSPIKINVIFNLHFIFNKQVCWAKLPSDHNLSLFMSTYGLIRELDNIELYKLIDNKYEGIKPTYRQSFVLMITCTTTIMLHFNTPYYPLASIQSKTQKNLARYNRMSPPSAERRQYLVQTS